MESTNGHLEVESYQAGEIIFNEGDIDFHFYIVEQGSVQIFTRNESQVEIPISTISEGESFGEFALLDRAPRSASARALSPCQLVKVSEEGFEQLLSELPEWASSMLKNFAIRLKNMNHLVKNLPQFVSHTD